MKKLVLTGISLLFALTFAFAQSTTPESKAKEKVAKLTTELTLTTEQQPSIYEIVLTHVKAKEALKADASQSPEAAIEAKKKLQMETDAKIKEQLSDEQKMVYDKMIAERDKKKDMAPASPMTPPAKPVQPTRPAQPM